MTKLLLLLLFLLQLPACQYFAGGDDTQEEALSVRERRNRALVEQLRALGADPKATHTLVHHLYCPQRAPAEELVAQAKEQGLTLDESGLVQADHRWRVDVLQRTELSVEAIDRFSARVEALAQAHDGVYEGWTTTLDSPDKEPPQR